MAALLHTLLTSTPAAAPDAAAPDASAPDASTWFAATAPTRALFSTTIERALVGGALADRVAFAFAAGYTEALRALVPSLDGIGALCATEADGNHPRAIKTRLDNHTLTGHKRWATGASHASSLLVVATTGDGPDGRPLLKLARVSTRAPNLRILSTAAPFVPEIEHAELFFDRTPIEELLPGDGYDDYLKPFRSVEDLHVHAALLAYLLSVTRRHALPATLTESLLALALSTTTLASLDLRTPAAHLALAGLLDLAATTITAVEAAWSSVPSDEWHRWQRDRPLLQVAAKARIARRDKARALLQR